MSEHELSHLNEKGEARMVDVSSKPVTYREALAEAFVKVSPEVLTRVQSEGAEKGDVLGVARVAGIMAAKRTSDLIPLCHPIALSSVSIDLDPGGDGITIRATAKTAERTGVEMEALVAASVAALTVYDMVKSLDRSASIERVRLLRKSGGKSGDWSRGE